jgi:hypothetical protein
MLCFFVLGCNFNESKTTKVSFNDTNISSFLCKTIKWQQFWFERWNKKLIEEYFKRDEVDIEITSLYSDAGKKTYYEIYSPELNCIFYMFDENNTLYLNRIEWDSDLKPVGKTVRTFFAENFNLRNGKKMSLSNRCNIDILRDKELDYDDTKIYVVKKIVKEFIENSKTFEKIPLKLRDSVKNGNELTIYVGKFYNDYPDIVLLIKEVPFLAMITRDSKNEIMMNHIFDKNNLTTYNDSIKKVVSNGTKLTWKNDEVE